MLRGPRQRFSVRDGVLRFEADLAGDELDEAAAVDGCHLRDLHATLLPLMGLDHERLTHLLGGLADKTTGVVGTDVIRGPIA